MERKRLEHPDKDGDEEDKSQDDEIYGDKLMSLLDQNDSHKKQKRMNSSTEERKDSGADKNIKKALK